MKAGACRDGACLKAGGYACHGGTFGAGGGCRCGDVFEVECEG